MNVYHTPSCTRRITEEDGRERLVKIIGMVAKDRSNAESRARAKNNLCYYETIMVTSRADTTASLNQTSHS